MKTTWILLTASLVILVIGLGIAISLAPPSAGGGGPTSVTGPPLRIGLVPERDIFAQRKRYQALAGYIAKGLNRPVQLVTLNTYEGVLEEFRTDQVDAAFLGSMVAVLAFDRMGARVLVKPELPDGVSTYRGVIFVPEDSPVQSIEDMRGQSIAVVRATTAGNLYPVYLLHQQGILEGPDAPTPRWVGTHDDVILEVMDGKVDVGAVKDLRLAALKRRHPQIKVRRLATSPGVPNNALVVGKDMDAALADQLSEILLSMDQSDAGKQTLAQFGALRFVPCDLAEYSAIYDMVDEIGSDWERVGVTGPPPSRPEIAPVP